MLNFSQTGRAYWLRLSSAARIVVIYVLISALWIFVTEPLVAWLVTEPAQQITADMLKGWGFVVITAIGFYLLIRRTAARLTASEAQMRALFNNLPQQGVIYRFIRNEQGVISDWEIDAINPLGAASIGGTPANLIGRRAMDLFGPQIMAPYLEIARQVAATGQPQLFESHFESNGRDYLSSVFLVGPEHYANISIDITERQQAEAALRQSEEQLRFVLDNTSDFIARYDQNGVMVYASGAATRFHGYEPEEIVQTSGFERIQPEDHPRVREALRRVLDTGEVGRAEYRLRRKSGDYMWVEAIGRRVFNAAGEPEIILVQRDITERKQAEQALRASEEKYRSLLGSLESAVVTVDDTGRFLYLNERAAQELGGTPDRFIGSTMADLFPEPFASRQLASIQNVLSTDRPRFDTTQTLVQGQARWYRTSIQPLHDETGRGVQVLLNTMDVTPLIQTQRDLEDLNRTLEERVAQRTVQLEAAIKELEAFSYSVAHDLRAPLRAIDGYAHILREEAGETLSAESERCLKLISANARDMGLLVDALLDFARLGRQALNIQSVDMQLLVAALVETMTDGLGDRQVEVRLNPLCRGQGDAELLKQVWANLLSNAFKYTREADPAVIEIGCFDQDQTCAYYVKDNGVGFDMQYVHKLFGVFQRLHSVEEFEGVGVGLALVQRIIQRHGGRVWAEAAEGQGATFFFTLG